MRTVKTAFIAHDLAKLLTSCKHAYYTGSIGITDEEYDHLEKLLERLCPNHPILQVVGIPSESYRNPRIDEVINLMGIDVKE